MNTPVDKEKFLRLIEDNKAIIWKICHSYCRNHHQREDLAQEIIYQLWRSAGRFDNGFKFSTWMYRVALNVAITFYRKETKSSPVIALADNHLELAEQPDMEGQQEENVRHLQQAMNQLKELDRAMMILYLEEKSYAEIGEILGITETNVATKINRIKDRLKQELEKIKQ
jgi:RNA polymerase sigma factor (sigma-70 family)